MKLLSFLVPEFCLPSCFSPSSTILDHSHPIPRLPTMGPELTWSTLFLWSYEIMVLAREGSQVHAKGNSRGTVLGKSLTPGEAEETGRRKCRHWYWWWCSSYDTDSIPRENRTPRSSVGGGEVEQKTKGATDPHTHISQGSGKH